ncbi:MAG: branched-chain amino acid transport system substrate-binding protein [Candidatus Atribacteria bacterium]|nr:branched-chain amino acid transport system substrate-binding protein [Candidatus Atribacteria bacterium]
MRSGKRVLVFLLAIVLVAMLLPAIGMSADEPETFNLGVLLPLTGTFAAVAETQEEAILLAVDEVNEKGGLNMPWGKVKVEATVMDDEVDINVGVRRFRYLKEQGAHAVVGQVWAPLAMAINELCKKDPFPYFPVNVAPLESFKKGSLADCTFAAGYTPWTVGYMAGYAAINILGKKNIFFLSRSDAWGWDIGSGLEAACEKYGGTIVGSDEVAVGTSDFTTVLEKVKFVSPEVFISAQFGGDAIALIKQSYDMGLHNEMVIFNSFVTNVVAEGLPPEAREGLYGMHFFYHDLSGFEDQEVVKMAESYVEGYTEKYGGPPDAYATIAYIATTQLFEAVERAGSFEPEDIQKAIMDNPDFVCVKGPAKWRIDHQPIYDYAAFLVRGKGLDEQTSKWDFFEVIDALGGEEMYPSLESLGY